jgi:hypothetical protein
VPPYHNRNWHDRITRILLWYTCSRSFGYREQHSLVYRTQRVCKYSFYSGCRNYRDRSSYSRTMVHPCMQSPMRVNNGSSLIECLCYSALIAALFFWVFSFCAQSIAQTTKAQTHIIQTMQWYAGCDLFREDLHRIQHTKNIAEITDDTLVIQQGCTKIGWNHRHNRLHRWEHDETRRKKSTLIIKPLQAVHITYKEPDIISWTFQSEQHTTKGVYRIPQKEDIQ